MSGASPLNSTFVSVRTLFSTTLALQTYIYFYSTARDLKRDLFSVASLLKIREIQWVFQYVQAGQCQNKAWGPFLLLSEVAYWRERVWDNKQRSWFYPQWLWHHFASLVSEGGSLLESFTSPVSIPSPHCSLPSFSGSGFTVRLFTQETRCWILGLSWKLCQEKPCDDGWTGTWGRHSLHPRQSQKICSTTTSLKFLWFSSYLSTQGESDDYCSLIKHFSEGIKASHSLRLMCF